MARGRGRGRGGGRDAENMFGIEERSGNRMMDHTAGLRMDVMDDWVWL